MDNGYVSLSSRNGYGSWTLKRDWLLHNLVNWRKKEFSFTVENDWANGGDGGGGFGGGGGTVSRNGGDGEANAFGCSNCSCCKDKCADKYSDNSDKKKECKTDVCRGRFGRSACDD